MRARAIVLPIIAIAALGLVACGDDGDDSGGSRRPRAGRSDEPRRADDARPVAAAG